MNYADAIILGLIQGLTEFLPVSSSGHLVLAEYFLKAKMPGVLFELMVHFGTLMAVLAYFHKQVWALIRAVFVSSMIRERRVLIYLIVATIPAVVIAVIFGSGIERAFGSPLVTSSLLTVTGIILLATVFAKTRDGRITLGRSILIGLAQALAILPGISRSGATISAGLFAGAEPLAATEFSFMLSIPAIAGAIVYKFKEILSISAELLVPYVVATVVAFLSGLLAVHLLLGTVRKGRFCYFGIYCLIVGLIGIIQFGG
jgi:undecaprenyl-diphosphatase